MNPNVLVIDTAAINTLLEATGETGLNVLLSKGDKLIIPEEIIKEVRRNPSPDKVSKFNDWLDINDTYIERPNFGFEGSQAGDKAIREFAMQNKDIYNSRFLSDDTGIYNFEQNKGFSSDQLEARGQYERPYYGVGEFINERLINDDITPSAYNNMAEDIRSSSRFTNNISPDYQNQYWPADEVNKYTPSRLPDDVNRSGSLELKAGTIGDVAKALSHIGFVGEVVSAGIVIVEVTELYENYEYSRGNKILVEYLFEIGGGISGSLAALALIAGNTANPYLSIAGAVAGSIAGSFAGKDLGAALYDRIPETFDAIFGELPQQIGELMRSADASFDQVVDLLVENVIGYNLTPDDGDNLLFSGGIANVNAGAGDDVLIGWQPDFIEVGTIINPDDPESGLYQEAQFLTLDGGAGNDTIITIGGEGAQLFGGAGNDDFYTFGTFGAQITGGTGADTFFYADYTLITDGEVGVDGEYVHFLGYELTGGIKWGLSESSWAYDKSGLFRYGKNSDGELAIDSALIGGYDNNGGYLYVANYHDPLATDLGGRGTLGITIGNIAFSFSRLIDLDKPGKPLVWQLDEIFDLIYKAYRGEERTPGADPLVFDLDGDGIELSTRTNSSTAFFDLDGDGFAERTGWVRPDDGLLVHDANADGMINDISELFGSANQSGFAELATYDSNSDGAISSEDSIWPELQIWQDVDSDGVVDENELLSLQDAGIQSISLSSSEVETNNSNNIITATGSFTTTNGETREVADITFNISNHDTQWQGDDTVSAEVSTLPNLRGFGVLTDLNIAMTNDQQLLDTVRQFVNTSNTPNIDVLRAEALKVLSAWKPPVETGEDWSSDTATYPAIRLLVSEDSRGHLNVSEIIIDDIAQSTGELFDPADYELSDTLYLRDVNSSEIIFYERYLGERLFFDEFDAATPSSLPTAAMLSEFSNFFSGMLNLEDSIAVRLAAQSGLSDVFEGLDYDVASEKFIANSDSGLVPFFTEIFDRSPDIGSLQVWERVVDLTLGDFERGGDLQNSFGYLFQNIVAAYENTSPSFDLDAASISLGIEDDLIISADGTTNGTNDHDLFYIGNGSHNVTGNNGVDNYIIGRNFGSSTIDNRENFNDDFDSVRFASYNSDELIFTRDDQDLVITTTDENYSLTIIEHFRIGIPTGLSSSSTRTYANGVDEFVFADGEVLSKYEIAELVARPSDTSDILIGHNDFDVFDSGAGDDIIVGANGSDIYYFGVGDDHDIVMENYSDHPYSDTNHNITINASDSIKFKGDLTYEDLTFSRSGNKYNDLIIDIGNGEDSLTIIDQFDADYTGPFGTRWLSRIENYVFEDGSAYSYETIMEDYLKQFKRDDNDLIVGFAREDILDGGAGDDILTGGNENDTYIFGYGYGNDRISESGEDAADDLSLLNQNILSGQTDTLSMKDVNYADITFSIEYSINSAGTFEAQDLKLSLSDGSSLFIHDQYEVIFGLGAYYVDRIEVFEFADQTLTHDMIFADIFAAQSTDGDDVIVGDHNSNRLDGGAGNDELHGSSGNDIYVWGQGYGNDIIKERTDNLLSGGDSDVLEIVGNLTPEDIFVRATDTDKDIVLTIIETGETLTLEDQLGRRGHQRIEFIKFSDGTELTAQDLVDLAVKHGKTAGDDHIYGSFSADILDGGLGDDILEGGNRGDTYHWNRYEGSDLIIDYNNYAPLNHDDKLIIGNGINFDDLHFGSYNNGSSHFDLIITDKATDETLIIDRHWSRFWGIEEKSWSYDFGPYVKVD